jgi:hypothetical protein
MSYSVTYGQEFLKRNTKKGYAKPAVLAGVLVMAVVLLSIPQIREPIRNFLLPGDGAVTAKAIESFADDMKSGTSFYDAAQTFCMEILQNG